MDSGNRPTQGVTMNARIDLSTNHKSDALRSFGQGNCNVFDVNLIFGTDQTEPHRAHPLDPLVAEDRNKEAQRTAT